MRDLINHLSRLYRRRLNMCRFFPLFPRIIHRKGVITVNPRALTDLLLGNRLIATKSLMDRQICQGRQVPGEL